MSPGTQFYEQPFSSLLPKLVGKGSTPANGHFFGTRKKRRFGYPLMDRPSSKIDLQAFPRYPVGAGNTPGGDGGVFLQGMPGFQSYWGFGRRSRNKRRRSRSKRASKRTSKRRSRRKPRRKSRKFGNKICVDCDRPVEPGVVGLVCKECIGAKKERYRQRPRSRSPLSARPLPPRSPPLGSPTYPTGFKRPGRKNFQA